MMSWLSLPRFGLTSVVTDMTLTGKAQILMDSTDRVRMLLHFGQPLINLVNYISQAILLTSGRLVKFVLSQLIYELDKTNSNC